MFAAGSTTGSASQCSWAPCASSARSCPTPPTCRELVAVHVAAQLGIADPGVFKGYAQRRSTQWEHAEQIRTSYGYRDFSDPAVQAELTGWLTAHQPAACRVDDRQRRLHRPGFGLFRLLGYQFSPHLADLGDARF